jgi:N-acetylmuramoyl-L-alanine amidase
MMIASILSLVSVWISPAAAGGVRHVVVNGDEVIVEFEGSVQQASARLLTHPQRIALDIKGSTYGQGAAGDGAVAAVRVGQFSADTTRIVFDLGSPALVSSFKFSPDGSNLTLALKSGEPEDFDRQASAGGRTIASPTAEMILPPRSRHSVTMPLMSAGAPLPRPHIYGPAGRPLVVLDPGHGGQDPGAINPQTGQREKDVTLATAKRIRDALLATGRVRVALTREDDHFIVLRERSAIARNIGADLFMSIHADSEPGSDARGATVYTLSDTASDKEAQALAARENKADIIHGVNLSGENADVASILLDLAQRETMNRSSEFASLLKRESVGQIPFRSDYHRTAGFAVLKQPDMPSCLLEIGYISNPTDVQRIASAEGQSKIAAGITKAVEIHFAKQLASK